MPSVQTREQRSQAAINSFARMLEEKGWERDGDFKFEEILPEADIIWKPHCVFKKREGNSARIAVEVEEIVNIPSFLMRFKERYAEQLKEIEIVVLSLEHTPLDFKTINDGLTSNIPIFVQERDALPRLVLDPTYPSKVECLDSNSVEELKRRYAENKRIPKCLISELENVNSITYSGDLRQFANDYKNLTFLNSSAEHDFIKSFLKDRLGARFNSNGLFDGLNILSLLEDVSQLIAGKREHFVHSFQTFLLGAVIIDKFYAHFNEIYSSCFSCEASIENAWFFTSIFHDVTFPFQHIKSWSVLGNILQFDTTGMSRFVPAYLNSFFERIKTDTVGHEWSPTMDTTSGLQPAVFPRHRMNHGVTGAIYLFEMSGQLDPEIRLSAIYPAALAILVHDQTLWLDLAKQGIFPMKMSRFPLVALLLYCDNIQEWARERFGDTASLTNMIFEQKGVSNKIWVENVVANVFMKSRHDMIFGKLIDPDDFVMKCNFFKSP